MDKSTLLAACKPLILRSFARSFNDTRTKKSRGAFALRLFLLVWLIPKGQGDGSLDTLCSKNNTPVNPR